MMDELKKMMAKKKHDGEMSAEEQQAKMDVIMELMEMAQGEMGSRVKSGMDDMKKVTVAAPDSESLEEGLEAAQDVVGELPESDESEEMETESEDSPASEVMEHLASAEPEEDDMNPFMAKRKKLGLK